MSLLAYITDPSGALAFVVVATAATAAVCSSATARMNTYVWSQPWVRGMIPLQRQMAVNFKYPEETLTDQACVELFSYVVVVCTNHLLNGLVMVPVVALGWEGAGTLGQLLFVMGMLGDVSFDIYDWCRMFCRTFLHEYCPSWGIKIPVPFFIIMGVLHHPLALIMATPLCLYHTDMPEFHELACSLLLAAGVCFLSGSYKFTLDTKTRNGALQYKAVVLLQLVTICVTRGYLWFTRMYSMLCKFYALGETSFLMGGLLTGALMTAFNVTMIVDAVLAASKWLPRPLPKDGEDPAPAQRLSGGCDTLLAPGGCATLLAHRGSSVKEVAAAQSLGRM